MGSRQTGIGTSNAYIIKKEVITNTSRQSTVSI